MDTTVALFFSLGLALSPASEPADSPKIESTDTIIAQQITKPSEKAQKRHKLVKNRIAATNAWLANKRLQRRELAQKQQTAQIAINQNFSSCNADWTIT